MPYHVWLSEIMLQQTTVATVTRYFLDFVGRWPTVGALAAAPNDDVMAAWAGLGYYARARNLHACAQIVATDHGGRFPDTEDALRALPGIGPYTAAAIASIAFGRPATPVDGNIERVMSRVHAIETPLPKAKPAIKAAAEVLTPATRPGDYAQALMDLGATVCTPKNPSCGRCPWAAPCRARAQGIAASLPKKAPKQAKPVRQGVAFWLVDAHDRVLLRRRPAKGLLGGLLALPSTDFVETLPPSAVNAAAPVPGLDWRPLPGIARHTFTHFHLELAVHAGRWPGGPPPDGTWVARAGVLDAGLPTAMVKAAKLALAAQGDLFGTA